MITFGYYSDKIKYLNATQSLAHVGVQIGICKVPECLLYIRVSKCFV